MGQRLTISEEQKKHLLGMYGLNEQQSAVAAAAGQSAVSAGQSVVSAGISAIEDATAEKIGFLNDGEFEDLIEKLSKCVDEDGLNKMKRLNPEQKKEFVERMEIALGIDIDRPDRSARG